MISRRKREQDVTIDKFRFVKDMFDIDFSRSREDGLSRADGYFRYRCKDPISEKCVGHYLAREANVRAEAVRHLQNVHAYKFEFES
jgi:hypothetical protein